VAGRSHVSHPVDGEIIRWQLLAAASHWTTQHSFAAHRVVFLSLRVDDCSDIVTGRMIRDRRCGPIVIIPALLAVAIGCGRPAYDGSSKIGGNGGGAGSSGGRGGDGASAGGGTSGDAGATGIGGTTGTGGMAGTTGAGAGGVGGTTGVAGATGVGGVSGTAGSAGTAGGGGGVAGTTGVAGTSGVAGTPGAGGVSGAGGNGGAAGSIGGGAHAGTGGTTLNPTPSSYRLTCDGSMAVMVDATHFLDGNDEQQGMRVYTRGATGTPLSTFDVSIGIGLATSDEGDFEDAARVGDRVYVISSHSRNKNGKLERMRYRFFAMDVAGALPSVTLSVPGYTGQLLDQMLVAENWATLNSPVIATLTTASNLSRSTDPALLPMAGGTNIEGLAWAPTAERPNQLLIGLRNPPHDGKAIVVSLLNADAVVMGATAQFGEAMLLDLGGLGIRGMTWSATHAAVLLIAGPQTDAVGPFRLYKWSGAAGDEPLAVADITGFPAASAPESLVAYPGSHDVQILFDQGDHVVGSGVCKDASETDQGFGDTIIHVQ
jgi:hypothetical protein